jgi:hypothetical protein
VVPRHLVFSECKNTKKLNDYENKILGFKNASVFVACINE